MAKFEFILGRGLEKNLQGMPEPIPDPHPVNGIGIDYMWNRKRQQWRRILYPMNVPRPTYMHVLTTKAAFQGQPEPFPFNGNMYPGFEIFRDVMNFREYDREYKNVKLLELDPKLEISTDKTTACMEEVQPASDEVEKGD